MAVPFCVNLLDGLSGVSFVGRKSPLGFFLLTAFCVAILVALGSWQIKRMHWKNEIIEQIEQGAKPTPAQNTSLRHWASHIKQYSYQAFTLTGHFIPGTLTHVGPKTHQERNGFHLYALFQPLGQRALWINCGWHANQVGELFKEKHEHRLTLRFMAAPEPGFFTPKNVIDKNQWYWADIVALTQSKALHTKAYRTCYASLMDCSPPVPIATIPWSPLPPNKHKEYALTWFLLALCVSIAGICGTFNQRKKKIL